MFCLINQNDNFNLIQGPSSVVFTAATTFLICRARLPLPYCVNNILRLARDKIKKGIYFCVHKSLVMTVTPPKVTTIELATIKGNTPLICAAYNGDINTVKKLIKQKVDVNEPNQQQVTALMCAINTNNFAIMDLLVKQGANINTQDDKGRTPLLFAAYPGNKEFVEYLLKQGDVDVNAICKIRHGVNALVLACAAGNYEIVELLLQQKGIDVNFRLYGQRTALFLSLLHSHAKIAKILIEHGAEVNVTDSFGDTPLLIATEKGLTSIVKQILALPNIDILAHKDDKGSSLTLAASKGYNDIVIELFKHLNTSSATVYKEISTAMILAEKNSHINVLQTISNRTDVFGLVFENGLNTIMWGAINNQPKIVEFSLKNNKSINARSRYGNTALIFAAFNRAEKVVELLLRQPDIDVNMANRFGDTALIAAVKSRGIQIVKMLLDTNKINVYAVNRNKETALAIAKKNNYSDIVGILTNVSSSKISMFSRDGFFVKYMSFAKNNQVKTNNTIGSLHKKRYI